MFCVMRTLIAAKKVLMLWEIYLPSINESCYSIAVNVYTLQRALTRVLLFSFCFHGTVSVAMIFAKLVAIRIAAPLITTLLRCGRCMLAS